MKLFLHSYVPLSTCVWGLNVSASSCVCVHQCIKWMCNSGKQLPGWSLYEGSHGGSCIPTVIREGAEEGQKYQFSCLYFNPKKGLSISCLSLGQCAPASYKSAANITTHSAVSIKLLKFSGFLFLDQSVMNFRNIFMKGLASFLVSSDGSCSYQAVNAITTDTVHQKVRKSWHFGWE